MQETLFEYYNWLKALHAISMVAWMAGMLYLPRLYVYHAESAKGSEKSETFKVMERRLLRAIMNPAMIATFLFGGLMLYAAPSLFEEKWLHAKLGLVVVMAGIHGVFSKWRKTFERDENARPATFYRVWNEVPTVVMIAIIILVIVKPF